ncbi:MAG: phosphonate ABC transporter ATP-binding protein [Hyphomicrobiales bacterium]|nr:phosphonate ABC transporter ATP-binding protein [Hyphomicrobiales bacterium]
MRLTDITVTYANGVKALNNVSLTIAQGSFCVLLGSSGAGKSTLLRCMNGLVVPTAGVVCDMTGRPIHSGSRYLREHRQKTGMIFQQHHLIGRLTALQNVLLGRLSRYNALRTILPMPREDRIAALESLDRVGLLDRALTRADELSGGQQQRVGIARALAQRPAIILADEPVASLDPDTSVRVLSDLHRICREDGITAIVSLHQVDLAHRFADRIVGVSAGRIVSDGSPADLPATIIEQIYRNSPPDRLAAE